MLWLINGLGPGGAERLLHAAARVADHDRFSYDVAYLLQRKSALVADLESAGVRVHALGARRRSDVHAYGRLRSLLRQGGYDIVHLHSPLVGGLARAMVKSLPAAQRPIVVSTEHNEWSTFAPATRVLNAAWYSRDAARWAVSEPVRESIWRSRRDGVEVLLHGIVLEDVRRDDRTRGEVRAELGATSDDVVVGTVANFRVQKAYPDLLCAARRVIDADPRVMFVAVGQGPLEHEIRRLHEQLGLADRFRHLGQRADVARLLSGWDVFALASHYEGFPVAVMEALGAGLPLVVTNVGGLRGVVVDGVHGRVVPPRDPDKLAQALLDLAADAAARDQMATAASALSRRFDIRNAMGRMEHTYAALAANGAVAPETAHVA